MPIFNVLTSKGGTGNALKSGDRLATERQTQSEHDKLLDISSLPEYQAVMAMPPGPQRDMAIKALNAEAQLMEKEYPKYWNDEYPRRPISQSSSWVGNVQYDPSSQVMNIQLGNKTYSYPNVSPEGAARFLNSDSLGRFLNNVKPYTGQGF